MSRSYARSAVSMSAVAAAVFALFALPMVAGGQAKEPVRIEFASEGEVVRGRRE